MTLAVKLEKRYTYQDYLKWPDEERWEIIGGEAYDMSPVPTTRHQRVALRFGSRLERALEKSPCTVFIAPTDVVLSEYDVVQPDVFIVCDGKKITEQNIQGAPDLLIEVLSPNTALKDKREKKKLYESGGVKEYIIVDPVEQYVERFFLESNALFGHADIIGPKEIIKLKTFDKIEIPLWEVFETEPPENIGQKELEVAFSNLLDSCSERSESIKPVLAENLLIMKLTTVLKRCDYYIGNDSDVTHLAAMTGIKTIAIYGATDPAIWSPIGKKVKVIKKSCLEDAREEDVLAV